MIKHSMKFEARARFALLEKQGQQLADLEKRKFAIIRDKKAIYKLARLDELSFQQRMDIVKRLRPKPQMETVKNDDSKTVASAEGSAASVVDSAPSAPDNGNATA
jgi:hypothetical protein